MQIGIIGAGRVGTSVGKYFAQSGKTVVGFYDNEQMAAKEAAEFAQTDCFLRLEELVRRSDTLFITSPDGIIREVWDCIREMSIESKIICHCSGSLSSDVFSGIEDKHAYACSIHPMLAFSDKFSSYKQLNQAFFTIEGDKYAVQEMKAFMESLGNQVCEIAKEQKGLYHAAASVLSNHVVAVLAAGYELLVESGFSEQFARLASANLVLGNVQSVVEKGPVKALTGPIERGDALTVQKHLACIPDEMREMYCVLGNRIVQLAEEKNPTKDYSEMKKVLLSKGEQ